MSDYADIDAAASDLVFSTQTPSLAIAHPGTSAVSRHLQTYDDLMEAHSTAGLYDEQPRR
jgi:hypothetical protein